MIPVGELSSSNASYVALMLYSAALFNLLSAVYKFSLIMGRKKLINKISASAKGHSSPVSNRRLKETGILINMSVLALDVFLTCSLSALIMGNCAGMLSARLPVSAVMLAALISDAFACADMIRCHRIRMNTLTPSSAKEGWDNLPIGICFADRSGHIVLINHVMAELTAASGGQSAMTLEEIKEIMQNADSDGIIEISTGSNDENAGRLWRFLCCSLAAPELEGYTQVTAQDVTELHESMRLLQHKNEQLARANNELKEMYEMLSERIREQEILELKIRIHNNIGTSLLEIAELMDMETERSREANTAPYHDSPVNTEPSTSECAHADSTGDKEISRSLSILKDAVSYLVNDASVMTESDKTRLLGSSRLGLSVRLEGELPEDRALFELVSQAAQECATNCVRHAHGNQLNVRVTHADSILRFEITNNGTPPRHRIVEGSGLGSLRRKLEAFGGTMTVSDDPIFMLTAELPERKNEDD